jgi:hypothetical protein
MPKRHSRVQKRKLKGGNGLFSSIGNLFTSKKNDSVNKSNSDSYFGLGNLFSSKNTTTSATTTPSTSTYVPSTPTYAPSTPSYVPSTPSYAPAPTYAPANTTSSTSMNNTSSDYVSNATPYPHGGKNKKLKGMKGGYKYYTPNTGLAANAASFSGPTAEPHNYVGGKTRRRRRRGIKSRKQKKY